MKLSEKALIELGYDVVPFKFEDKIWRDGTDYFMGIIANGIT